MNALTRYGRLPTEKPNPASRRLDRLPLDALVRLMNREDARAAAAVARVRPRVAAAVKLIVRSLERGGRLFLAGAGTSGRLCVMEAAECPPTFNTPPALVRGVIAGGRRAVFRSQEGAEDRVLEAERFVRREVRPGDAVIGVAASGVTPFALAALRTARKRRAATVLVTCNPGASLKSVADVVIAPSPGPEILTGSTRLKAGTACKMILNMLTTLSMVRTGKVYGHWMVDLQPRSRKLVARGQRLIQGLGRVSESEAAEYFRRSGGRVKTAILMARKGVSRREAEQALGKAGGFLHAALR